jgi:phosphoribosylamine--glycine ligase
MRFLGIGEDASLGDMYMQLAEAGHEVKVFINAPESRDTLAGLIRLTDDWQRELDWIGKNDGILLFENATSGETQDALRREGFRVVGGSAEGDRMENDRDHGQSCMRQAGMKTAASRTFHDFAEALIYVRGRPRRYVFKMNGFDFAASRNVVGEMDDGADIAALLERYRLTWSFDVTPDFVLMDHVTGVEVGVGAYFNGEAFLDAVVIDWEHKKFFNGDLGELTGEMGTLVSYRNSRPLFDATLARMADQLRACCYVGYININTIVDASGIWPLEFSCRFGYPGAAICDALHVEGWDVLFERMATRTRLDFPTRPGFAVGVLLTVPPFPQRDRYDEISKGLPILFRKPPSEEDRRHLHLSEVEMRDGQMLTAGELGALMVVTGDGATVEIARREAYRRCANVVVPGLRYRTDIGARFIARDRASMQEWGLWPKDAC